MFECDLIFRVLFFLLPLAVYFFPLLQLGLVSLLSNNQSSRLGF
jgi:hypothetical protein